MVHGGERFTASVLVDDEVIAAIRSYSHLAPLHNPANLAGIEAVRTVWPDLPQVAVFEHRVSPDDAAQRLPLRGARGVVHPVSGPPVRIDGTSYRFVSERAAALLGRRSPGSVL